MNKFKDSMVGTIVILAAICFVVTAALAGTYSITQVTATQKAAEEAALKAEEVGEGAPEEFLLALPGADSFTPIESPLPEGVTAGYTADNGVGYIFSVAFKGFAGDVPFTIGLDADGKVSGIIAGKHTETEGIGSAALEETYLNGLVGQGSVDDIDTLSGATMTSKAVKGAVGLCFEAYGQLA